MLNNRTKTYISTFLLIFLTSLFLTSLCLAQSSDSDKKTLVNIEPPIEQPAPPPIIIKPIKAVDKAIEIAQFSVESSVYANIAQTSMTLTFYNPNSRNISADFIFPIPNNSTLTAYALDIDGVMVEIIKDIHHYGKFPTSI